MFAFFSFGLAPAFIVPQLRDLYEEFGVELPLVTQFVFRYSDLLYRTCFVSLPLMFAVLAGIESGFFAIPAGKLKTLSNLAYWLFLIIVIGLASVSFLNTFNAISRNLSATIGL